MPERYRAKKLEVFTIGHSTRPIEQFIELLKAHGVKRVIDVRTIPRSRHNPQFNRESLAESLRGSGIGYTHLKKLGGLRHPTKDSINLGWRNSGFRGFADYMQTPEFEAALERAIKLAENETVRADVRRGSPMAMPSFTYRRRAYGAKNSRQAHRQRHARTASQNHPVCAHSRGAYYLSRRNGSTLSITGCYARSGPAR